jgi:aminotransferase EvaB
MKIPTNDLKRHAQSILPGLEAAVGRVLRSGWFILGPEVSAFEKEFAAYCGVEHCVGVANGTDALELALRAAGVGPGGRVVTVANAGMYSTTAIGSIGAEPVYVDVEGSSLTMDPDSLDAVLTKDIQAVVVTHLYGRMAAVERIAAVTARSAVPLIEDCAQAHGASVHGRKAGAWGCMGCFSFYPTKNLGAIGDGGAVVTGDAALAGRVARFRQYGWEGKYRSGIAGGRNSRLDEVQAAVLRTKLPHLDTWNERRRAIARDYARGMAGCGLVLPPADQEGYVAHLYVIRTPRRDALAAALGARGVGTEIHYPVPDHWQGPVKFDLADKYHLPVAERAASEVLTLPCFPEMTDTEVSAVIAAVQESLG